MDTEQALEFVRGHHRAVLATTRGDGGVQLSPVAAATDAEGRIIVSSRETAMKTLNLRRRPKAWLCVFEDGFFGRWFQAEGPVEVVSLPEAMDGLVEYYRSVSGEHPDWDEYRKAMEEEKRVLLRNDSRASGPEHRRLTGVRTKGGWWDRYRQFSGRSTPTVSASRSCTSTCSSSLPRSSRTGRRAGTRRSAVAKAVVRLNELAAAGVSTIVDLTVVGLGRNIRLVKRVAEQVDLNIVVATGLYTYDSLPHYFDYRSAAFRPDNIDALEEFFLLDIEDGIAGPGVRPGHPQVRHRQARSHSRSRAGSPRRREGPQTHRDPDLDPHPCPHAPGPRATAASSSPKESTCRGSSSATAATAPISNISKRSFDAGSTLGMDRFGVDVYCPERTAHRNRRQALRDGLGRPARALPRRRVPCRLVRRGASARRFTELALPSPHQRRHPRMRERGVTEAQVKTMIVEAPRRLLDNGPGY